MRIKNLTSKDLTMVTSLHRSCLPHTTSSRAGLSYLQKFYEIISDNPKTYIALVAVEKKQIVGVITATNNLAKTNRQIAISFFPRIYVMIIYSIIKRKIKLEEIIKKTRFENKLQKKLEKPYIHILTLFVSNNLRKRGIGKKLVDQLVRKTSNQSINIYVDTLVGNTVAQRFYKNLNFHKKERVDDSILFYYEKSQLVS